MKKLIALGVTLILGASSLPAVAGGVVDPPVIRAVVDDDGSLD